MSNTKDLTWYGGNMKSLYICHTVYHLYISILKAFLQDSICDVILVDTIPDGLGICQRLEDTQLFGKVVYLDRKDVFKVKYKEYLKNFLNYFYNKEYITSKLGYIKEYDNVYIFNDYTEIGCFLVNNDIKYHLLEDGLDVYKQFDVFEEIGRGYYIKKILFQLFNIPYSVGMTKQCIDVEINDAVGLKTKIDKPIIVQNRKELEDRVGSSFLSIVFKVYGVDSITVPKNSVLIITQVLTEICVVDNKKEQYRFYEDIVKEYFKDYSVFIKPHPRDEIDYTPLKKVYNITILKKQIPMEVYACFPNFHFDIVVTYSSTSTNSKFANKIVRLDKNRIK